MKAGKEDSETYFALPFNPAGEESLYRKAHSIPYKLFDMDKDESVLIGSEFWNKVGNDKNTYNELLKLFEEVGNKYSKVIKKDYLGL
ncbi:type II restriction endonuclease TdeIII [Clostridium sporogenes]|nr:type II restriction endonuclease TdeIII [Clostridium sporogenes]KRU34475.1 type II restriction endonuclease TdeIII [Clostridium sporogenes]KRU39971.1 type II restriction endonuclease TdeIII [Clostridium sporogenes]OQP88606.1 type II restriction endonuclease TdeIII [Clostridium sporogenes]